MTDSPAPRKLTLLYQNPDTPLRDWFGEIFGPWIKDVVDDGTNSVVMDDCIVSDSFIYKKDPSYYARFKGKNAFLLLSPDEYFAAPFSLYRHFCGVFRSSYSGAFCKDRVMHLPEGYNPGFQEQSNGKRSSERKYIWSFLGQVNKSTRPECIRSLLRVEPNYWFASDGWQPGKKLESTAAREVRHKHEYISVLKESAFTPCPMGNVSQEALRTFEALQVGSIPVLEKRMFMDAHRAVLGDHPLPTFSSWDKAADYMEYLWKNPAELDQLQRRCMDWWSDYKLRLSEDIGRFLHRLQDHPSTPDTKYIASYAHLPGWSWFELSRHHSPRAFLRRVEKQATRVLKTGKFFSHK